MRSKWSAFDDKHWMRVNIFWIVWQLTWMFLSLTAWHDSTAWVGYVLTLVFAVSIARQGYSMGRRRAAEEIQKELHKAAAELRRKQPPVDVLDLPLMHISYRDGVTIIRTDVCLN